MARLSGHRRVVIKQGVFGDKYRKLLSRARIVFNRSIRGECNKRVFEGAAGGALLFQESAKLFLGFAPWGRKAFSAREAGAAEVYSPDSVDCITPTPKRANTIGKMSPSTCGPRR